MAASADAYREAQVGVLSSISEGFPYSLIEAMACGLPTVATGVGGVPEAVVDVGLVVPPRSPEELGAAILSLLADGPRRRDMGGRARRRVLGLFTLEHCLDGYRQVYDELGRGPGAARHLARRPAPGSGPLGAGAERPGRRAPERAGPGGGGRGGGRRGRRRGAGQGGRRRGGGGHARVGRRHRRGGRRLVRRGRRVRPRRTDVGRCRVPLDRFVRFGEWRRVGGGAGVVAASARRPDRRHRPGQRRPGPFVRDARPGGGGGRARRRPPGRGGGGERRGLGPGAGRRRPRLHGAAPHDRPRRPGPAAPGPGGQRAADPRGRPDRRRPVDAGRRPGHRAPPAPPARLHRAGDGSADPPAARPAGAGVGRVDRRPGGAVVAPRRPGRAGQRGHGGRHPGGRGRGRLAGLAGRRPTVGHPGRAAPATCSRVSTGGGRCPWCCPAGRRRCSRCSP